MDGWSWKGSYLTNLFFFLGDPSIVESDIGVDATSDCVGLVGYVGEKYSLVEVLPVGGAGRHIKLWV